ncbi:MAG: Septum formation initiator [Phormidesmis priestleyi Ana]|uniref:Septum formation initiator n=1 Tax=Phormidesmis priestleyi Ana TaxID=1666911 RepID=A0A0P8C6Z6_9CYAN|nr:MAG: Septum formation initiator [Phormidesmis priestleyi Ana]
MVETFKIYGRSMDVVLSVIAFNCLLAALVCWLAFWLWRWQLKIGVLAAYLQSYERDIGLAPQQMGYGLMRKRAQIVQARLTVAQWQQRSHQLKQLVQLLQTLRSLRAMVGMRAAQSRAGRQIR